MRRLVIDGHGAMQLGDEARAAGYLPGVVVDVVVTSAGSLLVTIVDEPVLIERRAVPTRPAQRALPHRKP